MSVHISMALLGVCPPASPLWHHWLVSTRHTQSCLDFFTLFLKNSLKCSSPPSCPLLHLWVPSLSSLLVMHFTAGFLASLPSNWALLSELKEEKWIKCYLLEMHWWQEHHPRNVDVGPVSSSDSLGQVISPLWASVSLLTAGKKCSKWSMMFPLPSQIYAWPNSVFKVLKL